MIFGKRFWEAVLEVSGRLGVRAGFCVLGWALGSVGRGRRRGTAQPEAAVPGSERDRSGTNETNERARLRRGLWILSVSNGAELRRSRISM